MPVEYTSGALKVETFWLAVAAADHGGSATCRLLMHRTLRLPGSISEQPTLCRGGEYGVCLDEWTSSPRHYLACALPPVGRMGDES